MKRIEIKSLAAGLVLGVAVCLGVAATSGGRKAGQKEYMIFAAGEADRSMENAVNKAAGQGWDLVSCNPMGDKMLLTVMAREVK